MVTVLGSGRRIDEPASRSETASRRDAAAERLGFTSREPEERVFRRERDGEPSVSLNMRVKLSVSNAFVKYCQENNLSYPQALTKMMRDLGIHDPKG